MSTVAVSGLCVSRVEPGTGRLPGFVRTIRGYVIEVNTDTGRVTVLLPDGSLTSLEDLKRDTGWALSIESSAPQDT